MNNLATKIVSKIWYAVQNPNEESHSGNKLIKLIEESANQQEIIEFMSLVKDKDFTKSAILITFVENMLIENNEFHGKAKFIAKTNDKSFKLEEENIANPPQFDWNKNINRLLVTILVALIVTYLFIEVPTFKLHIGIDAVLISLLRLSRKFKYVNGFIILLMPFLLIYQILGSLMKEELEITVVLAFTFVALLIILIYDIKNQANG